jgi:hypothetical protein
MGGTSFDAGSDPIVTLAVNTGDGSVVITPLSTTVPELASLVVLGTGLIGLVAAVVGAGQP